MTTLLTLIHVIVCMFLILVVLLQQGKGQDFASTFGGGGTQTAFGARGATTLLHRLTTVAAVLFMITSLSLTILISQPGTGSVIEEGSLPPTAPAAESDVGADVVGGAPAELGSETPAVGAPDDGVETEN